MNFLSRNESLAKFYGLIFAILVGLFLFLTFASNQYELNGVIEAEAVEAGGNELFNPNHLIYRPVGAFIYNQLHSLEYQQRAVITLQFITALLAAFGVGFCFLAYTEITQSNLSAMLATIGMAVSWSVWRFSTEAAYLPMAIPFIAIAIFTLLRLVKSKKKKSSTFYAIACGISCAIAILTWQANIFLWLALVAGFFIFYQPSSSKTYFFYAALTLGLAGILVGCSYIGLAIFGFGVSTPAEFMDWIFNHSSQDSISVWGNWDVNKLKSLLITIAASFIPVWEGLGLRDLTHGIIQPAKITGQLGLLALLTLFLGTFFFTIRYIRNKRSNIRLLIWLGLAYAIYLPFIFWWDPTEPLWFVIINIFFWGMVILVWYKPEDSKNFFRLPLLTILIVVIALANFTQTIWKNHTQPNLMLARAACVSGQMGEQDILLATDWSWSGYVSYFFGHSVQFVIGQSSNPEFVLQQLKQNVVTVEKTGGQIIMQDLESYSEDHLLWLESMSGLTQKDFDRLSISSAFTCQDTLFVTIEDIR